MKKASKGQRGSKLLKSKGIRTIKRAGRAEDSLRGFGLERRALVLLGQVLGPAPLRAEPLRVLVRVHPPVLLVRHPDAHLVVPLLAVLEAAPDPRVSLLVPVGRLSVPAPRAFLLIVVCVRRPCIRRSKVHRLHFHILLVRSPGRWSYESRCNRERLRSCKL